MKKKILSLPIAALASLIACLCLFAPKASAANLITWSAPVSFNGLNANQILTTPPGTIVGAVGFGNTAPLTVTLTGNYAPVTFGTSTDPTVATATSGQPYAIYTGAYPGATSNTTGNANLDATLNNFFFNASPGAPVSITLINLTPGATYSVQLFAVDDRTGAGGEKVAFQDPANSGDISSTITEASNVYVIGTFTVPAGSTSVTIQEDPNSVCLLNAMVVRAVSFTPAINFTLQPKNAALDVGDNVTLSALATGPAGLTPQWQSGPAGGPYTNLTDNGHITGSSTYNLKINSVTASDASSQYVLKLTSGSTSLTSHVVSLSVVGNAGSTFNVAAGGNINAAIVQAYNAGGGTVQVAPGTYYGNVYMYPNTTLKGSGSSTIIAGGTVTAGAGTSNVVVEDLVIDGQISDSYFSIGGSGPAGIFMGDPSYQNYTYNLTFKNVEIKNTSIAMQLVSCVNCNLIGCNFHDNGIGYSHSIYFTGDYNVSMLNSISSWSRAGFGAHLDFAGSVAAYSFVQCEFNGDEGYGIFLQDGGSAGAPTLLLQGCRVQFNGQSGSGDGLNLAANGPVLTSRLEFNRGYGANISDNVPLLNFITNGNTTDAFFSYDTVANWLYTVTPNLYEAERADGVTGPFNTADWSTTVGGNAAGAVDFNANHGSDGTITWSTVSAPSAGVYPLVFSYANGSAFTLAMPLTVNGSYVKTVLFPPTGGWSTYANVTANATLTANDNTVNVKVLSPGLGSPELNSLSVTASVPAAPAAPTGLAYTDPLPTGPFTDLSSWISLTWNQVTGATYYNVYRGGIQIATGVQTPSFVDKHVPTTGASYSYSVAAVNAGGQGSSASLTAYSLTGFPVTLSATHAVGSVTLTCATSANATSYNVYRSTTSGGPYTKIATSSSTTYKDTTGVAGTKYYYVMTASNGVSESLYSPQVLGTPSGKTILIDGDIGNAATQSGAAVLGATGDVWNGLAGSASYLVDATGQTFTGLGFSLSGQGLNDNTTGVAQMDAATVNLMRDCEFGYQSPSGVTMSITGLSQFNNATFTLVVYAAIGDANQGAKLTMTGGTGGNTASTLATTGASRKISQGIGVAYNTFTGTINNGTITVNSAANLSPFNGINGYQLKIVVP